MSPDSYVYNYVDKDDIKLPPQSSNTASSDHTFPKTTDSIPGVDDNGLYVPGALRQDTSDSTNISRLFTTCKMVFHRISPFIILAVAGLAFLSTGAGIIMYLTETPEMSAQINMPFGMAATGNWTTAVPMNINMAATFLPVNMTQPAFVSATRQFQETGMFPPLTGMATTSEYMPLSAGQTSSHDIVQTTNLSEETTTQGLPPVTTILQQVATKPSKGTSTLPELTAKPPNLTTTLPEVTAKPVKGTTTLPQMTSAPPKLTATLPQMTTKPPKVTTRLPEVTAKAVKLTSTLPQMTSASSKMTTPLTQVTTTRPQVTTKPPKITTTMPQVTTKPPKVTTTLQMTTTSTPPKLTLPQVTTTLLEMTTKPPKVTTTLPQVTTKPPKLTTKPPKLTTTLPQMTTTLQCSKLTPPANGSMMTGSKSYRKVVYFRCNPGYKLVGYSRVICLSGTWSGRSPTCMKAVRCPKLTAPANGTMTGSNGFYSKRLRFRCNPGYKRVGHSLVSCQGDGTWTGKPPTCKAVQCLEPTPPMNGGKQGSRNFQGVMRFRCNRGYNLVGATTITCQADGTWRGSVPTCEAVQCLKPTPPMYSHMEGSILYKGVMRFSCKRGYNLVGASSITCEADGTWSDSVPTCEAVQCLEPKRPMNGFKQHSRNAQGVFIFGCDRGYNLVGATYITCQADGTWSGSVPTCEAVQCSKPTPPMNGHMEGSSNFQGVMHFRCDRGYNLVGATTITCQADGTWSGSVSACEAVQCPEPRPPMNGHKDGSRNYQGVMLFRCDRGYNLVGASSITCEAD
ncbi:PREDICTED: CUB and sushi domain-containing protein 1-like, partial [Branchiostoma belcheri]|uniref:CUB and sushi domain-containing protein 1-like n=1 Tax=Branchiostoma belcheri TaxID=7741 RepID=A0A6P4Y4J9_BRABE